LNEREESREIDQLPGAYARNISCQGAEGIVGHGLVGGVQSKPMVMKLSI
jgi:hypothetical protein